MNGFNFFGNIPLFILILAFCIDLIAFFYGGFITLSARRDAERKIRGRGILLNSLYGLFIILLFALVFFLVSYFLEKSSVLKPPQPSEDLPPVPIGYFPPPPQFIEIEDYYFAGPWSLKDYNIIASPSIYTVLCKRNEEYDIIYIGETSGGKTGEQLLRHEEYSCWTENCNQIENLYLAVFQALIEKYSFDEREEVVEGLMNQISPPCPVEKI